MRVNSRKKGANGERDFISAFEEVTGVRLKRNYDQWAKGGDDFDIDWDINYDPDSEEEKFAIFFDKNFSVECKRRKKVTDSLRQGFWDQAKSQARSKNKMPIVVYREDYKPWRVMYPIMWNIDQTLDGVAELTLYGLQQYLMQWVQDEPKTNKSKDSLATTNAKMYHESIKATYKTEEYE